MSRIFVLSPANCSGRRGQMVMSPAAGFDLAVRLRGRDGVPLGEVFSFISGLYFRGKLAYAQAFARPPEGEATLASRGALVVTPTSGLRDVTTPVTVSALRTFAGVDIAADDPRYRRPLERSARALRAEIGDDCEVVLLGSIASAKYVDVLTGVFGERLLFPSDFVGRGDMSRGGLMLRAVAAGVELPYIPVAGAVRRGTRPPKLEPLRRLSRTTTTSTSRS